MNPAWVMVAIAGAGMVFQAGIGWSFINRFAKVEDKVDTHTNSLSDVKASVSQHEWRITAHDTRLHLHDEALDKLRNIRD